MAVSTTTTAPTGWAANAAHQNFLMAQGIANQPYTPYPGALQAAWNDGQAGAYNNLVNGQSVGQQPMQQAQAFATQAGAYSPQQVQGGGYQATFPTNVVNTQGFSAGPAQQATSQNFLDANLQGYMSPYTGAVVDASIGQLQRQHNVLQNQANARAASAGAFGGGRQAVMNSENNRNYMDIAGQTAANLYDRNFGQAQAAIAADQNRAAQTSQFNAGAGNQMAQFNAGQMQQAGAQTAAAHNNMAQFQSNAVNQAGQFGAEQALRAQLANQQAGLTGSQMQLQAANALNGMGLDQQQQLLRGAGAAFDMGQARTAFDQTGADNAYNQWATAQNYPLRQLDILQQGLNGYNSGETRTTPGASRNTAANVLSGALGGAQLGYGLSGGLTGWGALGGVAGGLAGLFG
jgi:hypothetical protein